jgi:hypothetical protein
VKHPGGHGQRADATVAGLQGREAVIVHGLNTRVARERKSMCIVLAQHVLWLIGVPPCAAVSKDKAVISAH